MGVIRKYHRLILSTHGLFVACAVLLGSATAASAASVLIVTNDKAQVGDGWIRFDNNEKQWVDANCRMSLVDRGVSVNVLEWTQIDAIPYSSTPLACNEIEPDPGDAGLNRIVVNSDKATSGYGWVEFAAGDKQWISASCRASLVTAGWSVVVLSWVDIDSLADRASPISCAALIDLVDDGGNSGVQANRFVTTSDKSDSGYGWVVFADDTKQWVDASCRTALTQLGLREETQSWPTIAAISDSANLVACTDIHCR